MNRWILGIAALIGFACASLAAHAQSATEVPRFVVDPYWPAPLPNRWSTGEVGGICVDRNDHVIALNRGVLSTTERALGNVPSPPIIEYDPSGKAVHTWGNRDVLPKGLHSCIVDHQNNIWVAGSGGGAIQKWTRDGKQMLLQIGDRDKCDGDCGEKASSNTSKTILNAPADVAVDPANGDVYVADGYGNHRIIVFNAKGEFLRQWGAKGTGPGQFGATGGGHPHCVLIGADGLVYACDRPNDRILVFDKMGAQKADIPVKLGTASSKGPKGEPGRNQITSVTEFDFFGPNQRYLIVAGPGNEQVWIIDRNLKPAPAVVAGFGSHGRNAGAFVTVHGIAVDSKGNLYTAETVASGRIQKFIPTGTISTAGLPLYEGSPQYQPFPK